MSFPSMIFTPISKFMSSQNEKFQANDQSAQSTVTKRAMSPAIEEILYEPIKVLDHGFVRVVDYMGNDSSIVSVS